MPLDIFQNNKDKGQKVTKQGLTHSTVTLVTNVTEEDVIYDDILEFIKDNPTNNADRIMEIFGELLIQEYLKKGIIYQSKPNTYSLLE